MDERVELKSDLAQIKSNKLRRFTREDYFDFTIQLVQEFLDASLEVPYWLPLKKEMLEDVYDGPRDYRSWFGSKEKGFWMREREEVLDSRDLSTTITLLTIETYGYPSWFHLHFSLHPNKPDELIFEARSPESVLLAKLLERFHLRFSKFPQLSPQEEFKELIRMLRRHFADNDGQVGIQLASQALDLNPNNIEVYYWLGRANSVAGQYNEVITHLTHVIEADPHHHLALYYLGLAHYHQNNLRKAKKTLKAVLKIRPDDHPTLYWLGVCSEALDQLHQAKQYYQQAIQTAPEKRKEWIRGESFLKEAEAAFEKLHNEESAPSKKNSNQK